MLTFKQKILIQTNETLHDTDTRSIFLFYEACGQMSNLLFSLCFSHFPDTIESKSREGSPMKASICSFFITYKKVSTDEILKLDLL